MLIRPGLSSTATFFSTTVPVTGLYNSEAAFTLSKAPHSSTSVAVNIKVIAVIERTRQQTKCRCYFTFTNLFVLLLDQHLGAERKQRHPRHPEVSNNTMLINLIQVTRLFSDERKIALRNNYLSIVRNSNSPNFPIHFNPLMLISIFPS